MGKRPAAGIQWGTASAADPTDKMLEWWFGRDPVNIGISAKWSSLIFLDDDTGTADAMEKLCEAYGKPVPVTYRVRTSKGWHWYFHNPNGLRIRNAGQGSFLKDEFGFDVRGNCGGEKDTGGYVIAAGSVHESGHLYVAEDPDVEVCDLPRWLIEILESNAAADQPEKERGAPEVPLENRRFTEDQATAYVKEQAIDKLLSTEEGGRNNALNAAAVVVGHFLPAFWPEEWAVERLTELADSIGLAHEEIGPTVASGLRKGMSEPYTKVDPPDPFDQAGASSEGEASAYEKELQRERIRRQVRAELDAENRDPLVVMSASEFLDSPMPDYLVPKMFYRDGLSVVFGPPGAAKSFLVLDVALSLATGTPWRNENLGRSRVHYIMAEGQGTNVLRTHAWLAKRGVDRSQLDGWFVPIPVPVMLTMAGIIDYLPVVKEGKPDLIILDTKNLMFAGKESQGEDYGEMLRTLHKIRQAAGGSAVVLIDHTGLTDETRTRGSNAQKGGLETEIRVTDENGVRMAYCTRDKSGDVGAQWLYKLVQVPEVPRPANITAPAVCVPVDHMDPKAEPFGTAENWNNLLWELPRDVVAYMGPGKSAVAALARFMRYSACGQVGFTLAGARKAVRTVYLNDKNKPKFSEDTVDRAWDALVGLARLTPAGMGDLASRSLWVAKDGDPTWE